MEEVSHLNSESTFPTINMVGALGLLLLAFVSLDLSHRVGVEMTSHGTSTAGWLVQLVAPLLILIAAMLEVVAVVRALTCLARYPASRTVATGFLLLFSIVVFSGFAIFAFGLHR